jgi:elongation factor Ts
MSKIPLTLIQDLRERTGLGMLDCKNALEESAGDIEGAIELLRKKGAAVAAKRAGKETAQGLIQAYIHPGDQIGVLVELNCETDFVARTQDIRDFAKDLCMHIAALKPLYISPDQVDEKLLERERDIYREQMAGSGKPEKIVEQIIQGKVNKFYEEVCLLKQSFIKNDQRSVEQMLNELIAKTGENIRIKRFSRFEIGA